MHLLVETKRQFTIKLYLPLHQVVLSIGVGGDDFDKKARENIIRIMDMGVALHNERVTTLVTYGVEGFPFSHHIYLIARPVTEVAPPSHGGAGIFIFRDIALPYRDQ
ncbi:unnamed protein product [Lupinus luteus]|uniref:Uncharacterized protein n=1 Tax=Lupinus luteus TaxID=3873 RepID=A0AAV1Y6H8_LUPLU